MPRFSQIAIIVGTLIGGGILSASGSVAATGFCHSCPECGCKVCQPEPETIKVKKHCWEIECKEICIPKFKWPWEDCCRPPSCGEVKTVKVLKKVEFECDKCGYKWQVKAVDCDRCSNRPK